MFIHAGLMQGKWWMPEEMGQKTSQGLVQTMQNSVETMISMLLPHASFVPSHPSAFKFDSLPRARPCILFAVLFTVHGRYFFEAPIFFTTFHPCSASKSAYHPKQLLTWPTPQSPRRRLIRNNHNLKEATDSDEVGAEAVEEVVTARRTRTKAHLCLCNNPSSLNSRAGRPAGGLVVASHSPIPPLISVRKPMPSYQHP